MKSMAWVSYVIAPAAAYNDRDEGNACVMGHVRSILGLAEDRFPNMESAEEALIELGVPPAWAGELASAIMVADDHWKFDRAWRLLGIAHRLVYRDARRRMRAERDDEPLFALPRQLACRQHAIAIARPGAAVSVAK